VTKSLYINDPVMTVSLDWRVSSVVLNRFDVETVTNGETKTKAETVIINIETKTKTTTLNTKIKTV